MLLYYSLLRFKDADKIFRINSKLNPPYGYVKLNTCKFLFNLTHQVIHNQKSIYIPYFCVKNIQHKI